MNNPITPAQPSPGVVAGLQEQGQTDYEKLRVIYRNVVRAAMAKGTNGKRLFKQADIDDFVRSQTATQGAPIHSLRELTNLLHQYERSGSRPIEQSDLSPLEKGALARTALVGHGMTLGHSDELSGLASAAGRFFSNDQFSRLRGVSDAYREGRDQSRKYIETARRVATNAGNPDIPMFAKPFAHPEAWGQGATALLGAEALVPESAGLIPGAGYGGAVSLANSIGEAPDLSAETLRERGPRALKDAGITTLLGLGVGLGGKALSAVVAPGWLRLKKALNIEGGTPGLQNAVNESGVERPMLAELQNTQFAPLARELPRIDPRSAAQARRAVRAELDAVAKTKEAIGAQYDAMQTPVSNVRARAILDDEYVQPIIDQMKKAKLLKARQPVTGRVLEDIRQRLARSARAAYNRQEPIVGEALRARADELQSVIDNLETNMPEMRARWRAAVTREESLNDLYNRLSRKPRGSQMPSVRTGGKMGNLHHGLQYETGTLPYQLGVKEARQMVGPLFTPGSASDLAGGLHDIMPWWMGRLAPATGAAINPYFQMQPDTTQEH